jgi:predicted glycoside hydrolase/deacetylase ChbG (UPF0249 family)
MKMFNHRKSRKIIVNADDFGLSAEVNRAIIEAFNKKVISSATLMTNMAGFEEACELAHRHRLQGKLGLHLNLTSGYPLSGPIRRCPRLCDEQGMFRQRQTFFRLSKDERLAVETEITAQIKACLDHGLSPTHLDSHHHVHTEWAIGAAAITVVRQFGIKAIRLSRNCGSGIDLVRTLYKLAYNTRLQMYGLAKTRYFGSHADAQQVLGTASGDVEIMVHPTSVNTGILDHNESAGLERWFATHQFASYS